MSSSYQAKGGEGGGEIGNNGHQWKDYDDGVGKGATQTTPGQGCVRGSGCFDGKFGDGGSNSGSVYGCGGGGGWFGGASSLYGSRAAGGGSGFVFEGKTGTGCSEIDNHPLIGKIKPLKIVTSQVGGSSEGGKVTITPIKVVPSRSRSPEASPTAKAEGRYSNCKCKWEWNINMISLQIKIFLSFVLINV